MIQTLYAREIYLPGRVLYNGRVTVENSRVTEVSENIAGEGETFEKIFPGFVDIHMHGGNGYDVMDPTYEAINEISLYKAREGATSFCASTITSPMDELKGAVENIAKAIDRGVDGARIIGIFLEGPYINKKYKGAHVEELIRDISIPEIDALLEAGRGHVKSVAVAPELPGALEAIEYLTGKGIKVSLGHSGGTYEEVLKGIDKSGSIAIHTFNAMSPLAHRHPGMVGAVLSNDRIYGELICDLIHVNPGAMKVLCRSKGVDKIVLVTDCICAGGLPEGQYKLGGQPVTVKDGAARNADGNLAGSILDMLTAVKNVVDHVGLPLADAVTMASINPAKAIGLDDEIGSIEAGKKGDLVCVGENMKIRRVLVDGKTR